MIEVKGNNIYRGVERIGWLAGNYVYDQKGKKLGYFTADTVYDIKGVRLAHIEGNYVDTGGRRMDLENELRDIAAVGLSDAARIAITTFLGE